MFDFNVWSYVPWNISFKELSLTDKTDWEIQVPKVYSRKYQRPKDEYQRDYDNEDRNLNQGFHRTQENIVKRFWNDFITHVLSEHFIHENDNQEHCF